MASLKRWTLRALVGAAALGMAVVLLSTIRAGAADVPRPKDLRATGRSTVPPRGGSDYKVPLAEAGFVAGQGIVEPADREIKVGAPVAGVIARILVREGERVQAGAPLVELQDDVERAQAESAAAELESVRAQLKRAREGRRPEDRLASDGDAEAARARAALSELTAARSRLLKERGASSADEFDRARYQAEADRASERAQSARAAAAHAGWRRDVEVAQGALAQARAHLAEARARLDRLTVKAPRAGTVLQVLVREGEFYNANIAGTATPLLIMGDLSVRRVRLDIDERDIDKVRLGQRGYVIAEAFGARHFPGRVVEIGGRMGRKNLRTDEPTERIDTKILEVVLQLDEGKELLSGLRAFGYLEPRR